MNDLKFAIRQLLKSRGFTAVALLTLALCIGANVTIFAVVDAILIRPLPYADSDRLVTVINSYPKAGADRCASSMPNYFYRRGGIAAFESVSSIQIFGLLNELLLRQVPPTAGVKSQTVLNKPCAPSSTTKTKPPPSALSRNDCWCSLWSLLPRSPHWKKYRKNQPVGIRKRATHPPSSFEFSSAKLPSCASAICRQRASPMPVPLGLVV